MAISQRTFYGDESGSHGDGPFVMSGYLATDHTWGQLENQWHEVIQDSTIGGRPIGHFRMRECFKLEGQFEGMR